MQDKNGFTLVELLAIIILISVIGLIATFSINGIRDSVNKYLWKNKVSLIENAAQRYASDNMFLFDNERCIYISVETLINRRYIATNETDDEGQKIIINNVTGLPATEDVEACLDNDVVYTKYN